MKAAPHVVGIFVLAVGLASAPTGAAAQDEYRVRPGQSLARIARRQHVTVSALAAANGLSRDAQLRAGQVLRIPESGTHYVTRGETLARVARGNQTTVRELRRLNRLTEASTLRVGQRLVLPAFQESQERQEAANRWGAPRNPGVATLYRRTIDARLRVRLVDRRGRARRTAVRRIQELMRPRRNGRNGRLGPAPPRRLVEIIARVSDHFGGRQVTITSGYRGAGGYTRNTSRHTDGSALDIRVRGVPNTELRDYLRRSFRRIGVGYYPRSHFVHLDVRDRTAYWVDWSGPGQAPRYQRRGQDAPADASDREIDRTGMGGAQPEPESAEEPAEETSAQPEASAPVESK